MDKYKGMIRYNGLVWRTYNSSLFGVKPDNDDIVQEVYNIRPDNKDASKFSVTFSKLEKDGNVSDKIIHTGTREECQKYIDRLADERVDPKMTCYASFTIQSEK